MQVLVLICSYADMQRYEKHEKYMVISYVSTRQIVLFLTKFYSCPERVRKETSSLCSPYLWI